MKILHINVTYGKGSTGRLVADIHKRLQSEGIDSYVASAFSNINDNNYIKIGTIVSRFFHLILTRIFDLHGFGSIISTLLFVLKINRLNIDIVNLHNIHGYYLNYPILFFYLRRCRIKIVWTLHDCWAFTGHCCYYNRIGCKKWMDLCNNCEILSIYPKSVFFDNSKLNFRVKKYFFNSIEKIEIVTVSNWLEMQVKNSFLSNHDISVIYNWIEFSKLPHVGLDDSWKHLIEGKNVILGVANVWNEGKGLYDFIELSKLLEDNTVVVLVGFKRNDKTRLPNNIIPVFNTTKDELIKFYEMADVFVTPSIAESFGLVIAESLSVGTPCVGYTGSAVEELITADVGIVVEYNSERIINLNIAIKNILLKGKSYYSENCIVRAQNLFCKQNQISKYIDVYKKIVNKLDSF